MADPTWGFTAELAVSSDDLVIAGPIKLTQCADCATSVKEVLIARLPIYSETDIITVNGVDYPRWGFAAAIISWDAVVRQSGVYNTFEDA
eukprot:scaffold115326_cov59-Attheya_sp.AAC.1